MTPDQKKKKASLHMQSACGEASVYIYIYIYGVIKRFYIKAHI